MELAFLFESFLILQCVLQGAAGGRAAWKGSEAERAGSRSQTSVGV